MEHDEKDFELTKEEAEDFATLIEGANVCMEITDRFYKVFELNNRLGIATICTLIDSYAELAKVDVNDVLEAITKLVRMNHELSPELYE